MSSFRDVIHSHRFDAELADLEPDAQLADRVVHAATFALARHPERGFPVPGTPFSIWPVYLRGRECVIYYAFNSSEVELISIAEGDPSDGP